MHKSVDTTLMGEAVIDLEDLCKPLFTPIEMSINAVPDEAKDEKKSDEIREELKSGEIRDEVRPSEKQPLSLEKIITD